MPIGRGCKFGCVGFMALIRAVLKRPLNDFFFVNVDEFHLDKFYDFLLGVLKMFWIFFLGLFYDFTEFYSPDWFYVVVSALLACSTGFISI